MSALATEKELRVLIADDHPVFLMGLKTLLGAIPDLVVVGEVTTGTAAVEAARRLRPNVVLMDLDMPGMNGINATRAILADSPKTSVLILTMLDDADWVLAAMRAGAQGYLLKGAGIAAIKRAVDAVRNGDAIFGRQVAAQVIGYIARPPSENLPFPDLTDRERAVLELVADARSNAEMARILGLSIKTVRNYLSRIFVKLQVADRTEAAVLARKEGLGH